MKMKTKILAGVIMAVTTAQASATLLTLNYDTSLTSWTNFTTGESSTFTNPIQGQYSFTIDLTNNYSWSSDSEVGYGADDYFDPYWIKNLSYGKGELGIDMFTYDRRNQPFTTSGNYGYQYDLNISLEGRTLNAANSNTTTPISDSDVMAYISETVGQSMSYSAQYIYNSCELDTSGNNCLAGGNTSEMFFDVLGTATLQSASLDYGLVTTATLASFSAAPTPGEEWLSASELKASLENASVSAVPVPAAVWLFASGLIGIVGMASRKSKS